MSDDARHIDPPNYDRERYNEFDDWLPVMFTTGGQTVVRFVPARYLDRPTETERDKAAWRAYALYDHADQMIDRKKLANPEGVEAVAEVVAVATAVTIYLNVVGIFGSKWAVSSYPPAISMRAEIDDPPDSIEEIEKLVRHAQMESVVSKLKTRLYEEIRSNLDASWTVWRYIFFSILCAIDQDYGPIETIGNDEFNRLFEQYKEREFSEAFHRATYYCGNYLAYHSLEDLNPSQWSIESLMEFLEFEPSEVEDDITGNISSVKIQKFIEKLQGDKAPPLEVSYKFKNGQVFLVIPPINAELEDLNEAIAAATAKLLPGGLSQANFDKAIDVTIERLLVKLAGGKITKTAFVEHCPLKIGSVQNLENYLKPNPKERWEHICRLYHDRLLALNSPIAPG